MEKVTQSQGVALADLLEKVLAGEVTIQSVIDAPENDNAALASCFHGLQHFLLDQTLRESDPAYRQMQEREMRLLIGCLWDGASTEAIRRISFLGSTE